MSDCCSSTRSCCEKKESALPPSSLTIALVGNPNCGKTTLFNALTGARQKIGNWPGVTVERKSGFFIKSAKTVEVVDLPGTYSLSLSIETSAIDECIACEYILSHQADIIVNIVDASNLERHLYLTLQLLEMGVPMILALNMMDVARVRQIAIDTNALSRELGCPVVTLEANKGGGIRELKEAVAAGVTLRDACCARSSGRTEAAKQLSRSLFTHVLQDSGQMDNWQFIRLLEGDTFVRRLAPETMLAEAAKQQAAIHEATGEEADIVIADARYQFIQQVLAVCMTRAAKIKSTWTERIDNIVLNRILGIPIFLCMMYLLFFFSINIGGAFQDFFD